MSDKKDEILRIRQLIQLDKSSLPPDGGAGYNRLIFASSPYLLQHSTNPVDWYPWGEEAFSRAASEDKPVFLSIGYATCHWCHVMEHESFENPEVAAVFNRHFVCIKVDREERPDIDEIYMTVSQIMTGSGGWPLNIFMTPGKRPFYAATYLPPTPRQGLPGIIQLLERVAGLWHAKRRELEQDALTMIEALDRQYQPTPGSLPDDGLYRAAFEQLSSMYDKVWGGFGSAPKFPMPLYLSFLLRTWKRSGSADPLAMVEQTLQMMRRGGVYDQLGFGFHRYAVDRQWLVPHFEKMLYDQALIATTCLETFQATGSPFYLAVAEEIFTYVQGEMTSDDGGFFSGQDADTEGEEGTCYLWTPAEIAAVIGQDEARLFCRLFGVSEQGNFEGKTILHLPLETADFAAREGILPRLLAADLERWRRTLLGVRELRIRPFRDEKLLTGWNGLMIAALAKGYALTGDKRYLAAARGAVALIDRALTTADGRLLRSSFQGKASVPAFLEDYASFAWGLMELHQATLEPAYLAKAGKLADDMLRLFNTAGGGLYETGSDGEQLPVRHQSSHDGVLPSGNGLAAWLLFRLGRVMDDERYLKAGEAIVKNFMGAASRQPVAFLNLLSAADYHTGPEVMVTLAGEGEELGAMLRVIHRHFIPGLAIRAGDAANGFVAAGNTATAWVCARGACRPPVTGAEALGRLLDELGYHHPSTPVSR